MLFAEALMLTETGKFGLTDIVMLLLVAGFPAIQLAFEVKTTLTISPFTKVELEKVLLFVPVLPPFNFH